MINPSLNSLIFVAILVSDVPTCPNNSSHLFSCLINILIFSSSLLQSNSPLFPLISSTAMLLSMATLAVSSCYLLNFFSRSESQWLQQSMDTLRLSLTPDKDLSRVQFMAFQTLFRIWGWLTFSYTLGSIDYTLFQIEVRTDQIDFTLCISMESKLASTWASKLRQSYYQLIEGLSSQGQGCSIFPSCSKFSLFYPSSLLSLLITSSTLSTLSTFSTSVGELPPENPSNPAMIDFLLVLCFLLILERISSSKSLFILILIQINPSIIQYSPPIKYHNQ